MDGPRRETASLSGMGVEMAVEMGVEMTRAAEVIAEATAATKNGEVVTTESDASQRSSTNSFSSLRPRECRRYQWEAQSKSCRRLQCKQVQTEVYHLRLDVNRRLQRLHSRRLEEADGC